MIEVSARMRLLIIVFVNQLTGKPSKVAVKYSKVPESNCTHLNIINSIRALVEYTSISITYHSEEGSKGSSCVYRPCNGDEACE